MKALLVCVSVSHGNTRMVADAMADVLGAEVVEPEDVDEATLSEVDLLGVGSGIYAMSFHPRLLRFVNRLPRMDGRQAFAFWTHGGPQLPIWPASWLLVHGLGGKGLDVVGTFSCLGLDTWLPLRLVGGINKRRPDERDLDRARSFARGLLNAQASRKAA
jgi:flavodoxin